MYSSHSLNLTFFQSQSLITIETINIKIIIETTYVTTIEMDIIIKIIITIFVST